VEGQRGNAPLEGQRPSGVCVCVRVPAYWQPAMRRVKMDGWMDGLFGSQACKGGGRQTSSV